MALRHLRRFALHPRQHLRFGLMRGLVLGLGVQGWGLEVWDSGFGVWGLGFKGSVWGLGLRVGVLKLGFWGLGFEV
jgi:hypothetical protein